MRNHSVRVTLGSAESRNRIQRSGDPAIGPGDALRARLHGPAELAAVFACSPPDSTRSIRLPRTRLPTQEAQPLGAVLNPGSPYFIAEEEIPRAGRSIDRADQRARRTDGSTYLWIGRSTTLGRGEDLSGLVFDQIKETPVT